MHNSNDLPSSNEHSPILTFNPTGINWEYTIEKTTTSMEPTKQNPCGLLYSKECEDYQINLMIEEIHNCQIPFFQTGQHVNVTKDLPHCTNQVIIEAFELRKHAAKRCSDTIPCKRSSNKILHSTHEQSYIYQVLQTIQMKLIPLCVWAEPAVLGSAKTALKFIYKI